MKVFLSALETNFERKRILGYFSRIKMKWNLVSFFYIRKRPGVFEEILKRSELVLVDSGAHSFQKGIKVDWDSYTAEYARFIKKYDCEKIVVFFEMDVDNILGYEKVKQLKTILDTASDKIIPVWHRNRGIEDFKEMCKRHKGKIVAITGFRNEDIRDEQYPLFVRYAHKEGCKIHCLGMTRKDILDKVPFDFTDSSSWKQSALYGRVGKRKVSKEMSKNNIDFVMFLSYKEGMKIQDFYYKRWKSVSKD